MFADCRSQFLLDRLGRCLKLIVSSGSTSCHEFASQFGLAFFYTRKTSINYRECRVSRIWLLNEKGLHCKKIRYFNVNLPYFLRFLSVACHLRSFNRIFLNKRQFTVDALRQGKCACAVPRTPPYCSDTVCITGTSISSIMFRILRI